MQTDDAIADTTEAVLEPVSSWWLSGTPLETEHQRLMRRRQIEIPWAQSGAAALAPEERQRLGETWTRRAAAEYLAVSTFSVLAIDLGRRRRRRAMLSLCLRAGIDSAPRRAVPADGRDLRRQAHPAARRHVEPARRSQAAQSCTRRWPTRCWCRACRRPTPRPCCRRPAI
jgi:hypothetical protein